jgi:cellulose synthase/poly-beta-1,6-N-acetylglucosamine synthase-like glycosyltransferase
MVPEITHYLASFMREQPFAFALLVILLEVPRYTFSTLSMVLAGLRKKLPPNNPTATVSVLIPVFNGGTSVRRSVLSALDQTHRPLEIIVINDGSTDHTDETLRLLQSQYPFIRVLEHAERAGKSAAINHAAFVAQGELLLTLDHDTTLQSDAIEQFCEVFTQTSVAAASGNLLVANKGRNPITALQSLEYLSSITVGKDFLSHLDALSCCSGAFSMFRADAFNAVGGLNVGPGEDLEITLRLRKAGYDIGFAVNAIGLTDVPDGLRSLYRQRLRWDGDAVAIRLLTYHELSFFRSRNRLGDVLQRLDYITFDFLPTLIFPFYLVFLWNLYGAHAINILAAVYIALFWLYALHLFLALYTARRSIGLMELLVFPVMPLYQGLVMRLVRFIAISDEVILSRSHSDTYVPDKIRHALYGGRH